MKKVLLLILIASTAISCFPDDFIGNSTVSPYANKVYTGENTEYCRLDPTQDVLTPYLLRIQINPGYVREVRVDNENSNLTIDFSRTGRRATITGTVSISDQVEPRSKLFDVDITITRIELNDSFILFGPEVCIGSNEDIYVSDNVQGQLTSLEDNEVFTIDATNRFYINESASYQNGEYLRGIILQLNLNGIPVTGQIVLKE